MSKTESLWESIGHEVKLRADFEPIMSTFLYATALNHTFEGALSFLLASKLDSQVVTSMAIRKSLTRRIKQTQRLLRQPKQTLKPSEKETRPAKVSLHHFYFLKASMLFRDTESLIGFGQTNATVLHFIFKIR